MSLSLFHKLMFINSHTIITRSICHYRIIFFQLDKDLSQFLKGDIRLYNNFPIARHFGQQWNYNEKK